MVDAAISFTIEKLSEFVTQHVNIRIGVKDDIEWLKDELGYLLISVRAVESQQNLPHVSLWTDSVRVVSNQALIILERCLIQQEEHAAHQHESVLDRMQSFFCICKKEANLYDIGKDINNATAFVSQTSQQGVLGVRDKPDSITDLTLAVDFTEDPMPILGSLSNLTSLCFINCGEKMVCGADAFPCLQILQITPTYSLCLQILQITPTYSLELQVDDGALPSLRAFTVDRFAMGRIEIPPRLLSLPPVPDFINNTYGR